MYLFSGLLTCGKCGANYTLRDNKFYSCASWLNGKACSNKIGVRRDLVERLLLAEIKAGLASPVIVEHVRQELTRRLRRKAPTVDKVRVQELEQEVGNLVDAIASGALRSSPAIAARLAAAESELERLNASAPDNGPAVALLPRLDELFLQRVRELERTAERDPVRARQALLESIDTPIALHPVDGVLEAEIGVRPPLAVAAGHRQESMVAGAGFEPATFGL